MAVDLVMVLTVYAILFFQFLFLTLPLGSDKITRKRFPVVTTALVLVNTLIFFFCVLLPPDAQVNHFVMQYGIAPAGKWKFHQLITHQFAHGSIWHLLGNLFFLVAFAICLEDLWGSLLFALF